MKRLASIIIFAMLVTVMLVACGGSSTNTGSNHQNTVKMVGGTFSTSAITISRGSTITFVDDPNNGALHILVIGQLGQQESENGAPSFNGTAGERVDVGDIWTTAPWNRDGTYHVTCTVHPFMNLTVTVKG